MTFHACFEVSRKHNLTMSALALRDRETEGSLRLTEYWENFNPALGFVNLAGIRDHEIFGRYRTRPEEARWREINHWFYDSLIDDSQGQLESRFYNLTWAELVSVARL